MGDVEDPYLYAAFPIYAWQQTEQGKWAMSHLVDQGEFYCTFDDASYGFRVVIIGTMKEQDFTYYKLKWS